MNGNSKIKGIIFDIDGTLILNDQAISGAVNTISILRNAGVVLRFVTNTTGRTSEQLSSKLNELGFDIKSHEIITSVTACLRFIQQTYHDHAGFLAIPYNLQSQFLEVKQTRVNPAFVVLGDLDEEFDYEVLNRVFNYIKGGAQLITFHRNPYFFRDRQTWLDSGAFTIALEYASGQKAIVTGKPAPEMFESAVASMGLNRNEVIVVGDDVTSDIQGAKNASLDWYLVETGKFKPEHLDAYQIKKGQHIKSIENIVNICGL
ncbi:HAD-IIA family hydrolase [Acinetobacter piscicola]|uniref:HAD-IIA family hydrolase n=1 Tax=Acinetobacter piscicola TaxID=2006115 RepID=UPI000B7C8C3C|nr:HAD-IIA family hydrolase [Acinetobacter piscicola]